MSTLCKNIELYKGDNDWEAFTIAAVGLGGTVSLPQLESFPLSDTLPPIFIPPMKVLFPSIITCHEILESKKLL